MRAVTYTQFGPAQDVLRLVDMPTPTPAAGEVLVRLAYSGANPSDAKARSGTRPGVTTPPFDVIIPHSDGSGVIEAVGDGVESARVGERVWVWNGQWQRPFGTAADYIALPSEQAVTMPENMSLEAGATLGIPGLTAAQTVFGAGYVKGQTLLVSGAGGAVGHNAVQLAKWGGATVIATAGRRSFDRVRAAGADHVLDYAAPDLATQIMDLTGGKGIDRAIEVEFGPNMPLLTEVMRPLGTIAAYGSGLDMAPQMPFGPALFKALKIDITLIYILPKPERDAMIAILHRAMGLGGLEPAVHKVFDLENCADAHDCIESGGRDGAVLLSTS